MGRVRATVSLIILFVLLPLSAQGPKIDFEFVDQSYGDILYALSKFSGIAIVADNTVMGKATFQFSGSTFERAFDSFLLSNRLYVTRDDKVWTVSRFRITRTDGGISLDAIDVAPARLLDELSSAAKIAIVAENLPGERLSIHASGATPDEIVRTIAKSYAGYSVTNEDNAICVRRKIDAQPQSGQLARMSLLKSGEEWELDIDQANIGEIIDRISIEEGIGYSNFLKPGTPVSGIRVRARSLDEIASAVADQAGAECVIKGGTRYYLPAQASDIAKRIRETDCEWETCTTSHVRMDKALPLLQARFPGIQFLPVTQAETCVAKMTKEQKNLVDEYIGRIDRAEPVETIQLRYISTQDFIKSLPPMIRKEDITDTGTGRSFFYIGPQAAKERLMRELKDIDMPKPRIRYDMLIVQYDKSSKLVWGSGADIRQMKPGDTTAISGSFGNLLNLNFDAITVFGYRLSVKLNAALSENRAQVFADTTLHGISGESVKFQNTNTYRYRDSNVDAETGKTIYTGITREIVSGVTLEINGWVSGDGMVMMGINATVSKRGADVSAANGNPPATSEKIISTKLSTADGEPVILSGLDQNDDSIVEQRTPFISRIPVVGWFFRNYDETRQKTEMVIYLVPHITNGMDKSEERELLERTAFDRLVVPSEKGRGI